MLSLLLTFVLGAVPEGELLYFTASWCSACRQMKPVVDRLRLEGFPIRQVDVDRDPATARRFGVTALPTFVVVDQGKPPRRVVGATSEDVLRRMLADLHPAAPNLQMPSRPHSDSAKKSNRIARDSIQQTGLSQLKAASVKISVHQSREHWYGSGTCVWSDGNSAVVLTAAHVVRDAPGGRVTVTFPDGRSLAAHVRYANPKREMAVLTLSASRRLPTVPVGHQIPRPREPVISIGYPSGGRQRILAGTVVSVGRWDGFTEASMSAAQGHSGGGLFHEGRLVGVLWGSNGTSLYASLSDIRSALDAAGFSAITRTAFRRDECPTRQAASFGFGHSPFRVALLRGSYPVELGSPGE